MAGTNKTEKKGKKNKPKFAKPFWKPLILCLTVLSLICCLMTYNYILADFKNNVKVSDLEIPEGEEKILFIVKSGESVAKKLKEEGLIDNVFMFNIISRLEGYESIYKSGSHYLWKGLTNREIMNILASAPETTDPITFPEGYTVSKIAKKLEEVGLCKAEDFEKAADVYIDNAIENIKKEIQNEIKDGITDEKDFDKKLDEKFTEKYPYLAETEDKSYEKTSFLSQYSQRDISLEGYLFPDTYLFDISATPEQIIAMMLNNFNNRYTPDFYAKAKTLGLSTDEVIKLASIVEGECAVSSERRTIAGVFYNRLTSDSLKKMQSCATIQYVIERDTGKRKEIITLEDEKINDIYNTYEYEGLPPGPICNPGIDSIMAVLNPKGDEYYFVLDTRTTSGTHLFAKTNAEHEKNKSIIKAATGG